MKLEDFTNYINLCKGLCLTPTWNGLRQYKEGLKRNTVIIA